MRIKYWTGSCRWPSLSSTSTTGKSSIVTSRPRTFSWLRAAKSRSVTLELLASCSTLTTVPRRLSEHHTICHPRSAKRSPTTRSQIFGLLAASSMRWLRWGTPSTRTRWRVSYSRSSAATTQPFRPRTRKTWRVSLLRCWSKSLRSGQVCARSWRSLSCQIGSPSCWRWRSPATNSPTPSSRTI